MASRSIQQGEQVATVQLLLGTPSLTMCGRICRCHKKGSKGKNSRLALARYGEGGINGECETCAPAAAAQHLAELDGCAASMPEVPHRPPVSSLEALLIPGRQQQRE